MTTITDSGLEYVFPHYRSLSTKVMQVDRVVYLLLVHRRVYKRQSLRTESQGPSSMSIKKNGSPLVRIEKPG